MLRWIVILSLVNWRITSLLHTESMFGWLRKWIGIDETEDDTYTWIYPDGLWGDIFGCFWCLSLWVAWTLSTITAYFIRPSILEWFCLWLGAATGAIITEKWIGRSKARW